MRCNSTLNDAQGIIDSLLELLLDGKLHTLAELSKELKIQQDTCQKILETLGKYELVEYQADTKEAKIDPKLRQLLKNNGDRLDSPENQS
ncbi:MAG: hypothetical protein QXJ75_05345 [Candidatus Bathyarchaeia archaeon]